MNIKENIPESLEKVREFPLVQTVFVLAVIIALLIAALVTLNKSKEKATTIVAKYDLQEFYEAQKKYQLIYDVFKGKEGDVISGDPDVESTLTLEDFKPSKDVVLTIVSTEPFEAVSQHKKSSIVFRCNFETGEIWERQK